MRALVNRLANMVARAVVSLADDSKGVQALQVDVLKGETRDEIERLQDYGFTSVPKPGAEASILFVGGRRDHGLAIAVDDRRYRIKNLESGEVAIYTDQGDKIVLKRGGNIEVTASTKVVINSPLVELGQPAVDDAVKGTTYRAAEDVMLTAIAAACNSVTPGPVTPAQVTLFQTANAAINTFKGAAATYTSSKVKVG